MVEVTGPSSMGQQRETRPAFIHRSFGAENRSVEKISYESSVEYFVVQCRRARWSGINSDGSEIVRAPGLVIGIADHVKVPQ